MVQDIFQESSPERYRALLDARTRMTKVLYSSADAALFSEYLHRLREFEPWSAEVPFTPLIGWRQFGLAKKHPIQNCDFESKGIYMFLDVKLVPIYIGQTETTLAKRIGSRYAPSRDIGTKHQFALAASYEDELKRNGIEGIPLLLRTSLSQVRIRHAYEFAIRGIDGIRICLFPANDFASCEALEQNFIASANEYNRRLAHKPMINKQHSSHR